MRILVAEDDYGSREALRVFLKPFGRVQLAENGQEALSLFREALEEGDPFGLVCLDIMMPIMDGIACLKALRSLELARGIRDRRETPVIMTTALGDPHTTVEAFYQAGATSYLVKPVLREKLLAEMQELGFQPAQD